jgi:hypothetical protein
LLAAVIAAALMLTATATFAAMRLLKPADVSGFRSDKALSAAFESENAINIDASAASDGFIFTLMAIVSGKDITDQPWYSERVRDERTYAVLAIQRADGEPMSFSLDDLMKYRFFASPLVKGLDPALYNAMSMNGGQDSFFWEGTQYCLIECDSVEMFADRGLYFAVCPGSFYDSDAFVWNERTGEVKVNPDFDGASAVFDLPVDKSLADPEKAAQWLLENQISSVTHSSEAPRLIEP